MLLKRPIPWGCRSILLLLWFFAGALLFCTSMLSTSTLMPQTGTEVCEGLAPVDQVVVILIDAMRPDFSLPRLRAFAQHAGDCSGGEPVVADYTRDVGHTLTYIEDSLRDVNRLSQGYFLVADAPTTTAQRIKAIATGTMPAFLEAGSNFNSEATELDSFVRQAQGRAIMLGDDTWTKLFPNEEEAEATVQSSNDSASARESAPRTPWKATVDVPSFDVADFHTNDDAVLGSLYTILEKETREHFPVARAASASDESSSSTLPPSQQHAKVIIGHFLGVDHIGHRLNADNPTMHDKLAQLDLMLHNVSTLLRARKTGMRTMMLVLGDHGMTNSGDHGGESSQETDTFLYAEYFGGQSDQTATAPARRQHADRLSTSRWDRTDDPDLHRLQSCQRASGIRAAKLGAAYQVDVTSTIAVLMGRPIPFSNFGRVLPEVLALADADVDVHRVEQCNYRQFQQYAEAAAMTMPAHHPVHTDDVGDDEAQQRQELARFSYYARKTRSVMNLTGMFVGSWMLLVAALSILWIGDVQFCLTPGSGVANWTMLVVIGRLITVFSNSFVANEDTELFTLLSSLLWISTTAWQWWRVGSGTSSTRRWRGPLVAVCGVLLCRHVAPYAYRHRFLVTHAVESTSRLEQWAAHSPVPERIGLLLGGLVAAGLYCRRALSVVVLATTLVVLWCSYKVPRWHHLAPCLLVAADLVVTRWPTARGAHPTRTAAFTSWPPSLYRYLVWVLWCSLLCNEGVVAAAVIAVYGCALPFLIRSMRRVAADTAVAVQLHLFSYVVFFMQGHQCMLSTIDWNSSFVGMSSYSLVGGGVLVLSRTFNAFLFVPVACALQDASVGGSVAVRSEDAPARDTRKLRHYVLHITVLQAAVSCFNGYIQKSHLMLFVIFCPKFLFDVVIGLMTGAGLLLSMVVA